MKKILTFTLILLLFLISIVNHPVRTFAAGCGKTAFNIVLKEKTDLKGKKDGSSKTKKTLAEGDELSAIERTNSWYKVCYGDKAAYVKVKYAKEVFSADETRIMAKALKEKGAKQLLSVIGKKKSSTSVKIQAFEIKYGEWRRELTMMSGVIGKKGFTNKKIEGDQQTPIGIYSFGTAFGKTNKPATINWPYKKTTSKDFWVDDASSIDYNKWVRYTGDPNRKWQSFEKMNHPLYKYGVVINYNMKPIIKGKGSAIFLHVWRGKGTSTGGCVASTEKDVVSILTWLNSTQKPHIVLSPKSYLKDL